MENRLYKHARVMASWVGGEGQITLGQSCPGRVKYYFEHSFEVDEQQYRHCFACVQWYKEYTNNVSFRNPLSVFYAIYILILKPQVVNMNLTVQILRGLLKLYLTGKHMDKKKREKKCFTAMYSLNSANRLVLPLADTFESLRYV